MHIVLVEPEIPGNTGNIARLCAGTGMDLHLVRPLGFSTDDKYLKRAGLDYWHLVNVHYHDSFADVHIAYTTDVFLVFGKETSGLPKSLLAANEKHTIRIPMQEGARSLNLSNAVAVVAYEALRQNNFVDLCLAGMGCGGSDHI